MDPCNQLKNIALTILMEETFSYVEQNAYNAYIQLALENKKIRGIPQHGQSVFFMYQGTVYPNKTPGGLGIQNIRVNAPILHWSLIDKFDAITKTVDSSDRTTIKNFFSAVLNHSFNNIVLDTFLPTVLITKLRKEMHEVEYHAINFGSKTVEPYEPIEQTQKNINMIKEHYHDAIDRLKELLMERFLLQE